MSQIHSMYFIYFHIFTYFHLISPKFSPIHIFSHNFTQIHIISHMFYIFPGLGGTFWTPPLTSSPLGGCYIYRAILKTWILSIQGNSRFWRKNGPWKSFENGLVKFSWKRSNVGKLDTVVRSVFSLVGQGFGPVCDRASAKMLG